MPPKGIAVFQDLKLVPVEGNLGAVRKSLVDNQTQNWVHDVQTEEKLLRHSLQSDDVIQFSYKGLDKPQATLTLWQQGNGYAVTNIVPLEKSQLNVEEYNLLLQDFVDSLVKPAQAQIKIEITEPVRQLDSWISKNAADALRRFSTAANKSTTNSHPSDAKRWETFVVAVYLGKARLSTDTLTQWLVEIDGWDEQSAQDLAIDYEKGLSLLETYDRLRGN